MTAFKKTIFAVTLAATAAFTTGASAQFVDPDYGGYATRYYAGPPQEIYWGFGPYWTASRDTACIQDRRDFAERTNFICR